MPLLVMIKPLTVIVVLFRNHNSNYSIIMTPLEEALAKCRSRDPSQQEFLQVCSAYFVPTLYIILN